ncbi:DUF3857 domain-containing protein, partial [Myxococcota bacterium]|nr:DUF3857 domain-containing protein [Myxococcota bacterium]
LDLGALRASGRSHALLTALRDRPALRGLDDTLALVHIEALRGEVDSALAGLDRVYAARPDLWGVGLEAAELEIATGRVAAATARLRRLLARTPGEPRLIAPLARLHIEAGALDEARRRLREAATQDEALTALQARLDEAPRRALGPPLEALLAAPSLEAPEGVEILYKHVELELDEDKRADRRAREVVRVLSEVGAARFNEWRLSYVPGAQALEIEEARLIRDGAPPASPTRTDVGLSEPEFRLYYDLRAEILTFKPRPGDVIEVAWRLRDVAPDPAFPDLFGELLYLQGEAPQREVVVGFGPGARAQLRIDATLRGLTDLDPGPGVRLKGVPAAPYEPKAPGPTSARAYLSVSTRGLTWAALDRRYQALLEGRLSPNAALQAKALAWVGDAQGDAARLARLYEEVAHRTRYVGLEFGVRSFQPAYPAETLSRGYGDCKDKATLLIALARSLNIPAQIVLLRTRGLGQLDDPAPSFALFDHAIVYAPSLGRYLDPTVDRNDPWVLPKADQGGLALIIGAASPPQIVPIQAPEANQLRWALDLDVGVDGVARGALRLAARGLPATQLRRRLEGEARPERALEALIGERWASAALQAVQLSGITPARDPLTVSARLTLPLPRHLGRLSLRDERRLAPRLAPTATRRTPLVLDYPWIEALDITLRPPPGGRIIAAPASPPGAPFGALQISHEERRVTQTLRLDAATISVADYPAFRRWLAAVDAAALVVEVQP